MTQQRKKFRKECKDRDSHTCIVPWCSKSVDDVHHIIERSEWSNGGYLPKNGASVCNKHHKYAERNHIPPQAFWLWLDITNPVLPEDYTTHQVNKWGEEFETPPWEEHRDRIKYPSTRHLLPLYWYNKETVAKENTSNDDTGIETLSNLVGLPLVITEKMDGGNMMLVNDIENPVRARNGSHPKDTMELMYDELYWENQVHTKLPERLQVFGEWLWAKHSIHYGCDCAESCDDVGKPLSEYTSYDDKSAYFQIFGVYDKKYNLWLSWDGVERIAETIDFPTSPVLYKEEDSDTATFTTEQEARETLLKYAKDVINNGGEGIVVRTKFPYHFSRFGKYLGKYVRKNHVKDGETHWSKRTVLQNKV